MNHPEKLNKEKNVLTLEFKSYKMIIHAEYDSQSKTIVEKGTLSIGDKVYNIELFDEERTVLCCKTEGFDYVSLLFYKNGSVYIGKTSDNLIKQGKGIITFSDGNQFEGYFNNDFNDGFGLYNGKKYKGEWENNKYIPIKEIKETQC